MTIWFAAGALLLGAGTSIYGANKASKALEKGGDQATAFQNRAFDTQLALARPQLEVGNSALGVLAELFGLQRPSQINFDNLGSGGNSIYGDGNSPLSAGGVQQAYRDILGRDADEGGLNYYLNESAKRGSRESKGIKGQLHDLTGAYDALGIGSVEGKRGAFTYNEIASAHRGSKEYQDRLAAGTLPPNEAARIGNPAASANYTGPYGQEAGQQQGQQGVPGQGANLDQLVANNPLIRFQREQGEQAIARGAAARGLNQSGGTLKDLTQFSNDVTGAGVQQFVLNPLFELAGFGPRASQQLGSAVSQQGSNLANIAIGQADARASAYQNQGNTLGNLISGLPSQFANYRGNNPNQGVTAFGQNPQGGTFFGQTANLTTRRP